MNRKVRQKWMCVVAGVMMIGMLSACGEKEVTQLPGEEVKEEVIVSGAEEEVVAEEKTEALAEDFEWVEEDGNMVLSKYRGMASSVTVPDIVDGKSVVAIGYSAFSQNETIEEVILPETITEIREHAFYYCESLKKAELGKSVVNIGTEAFAGSALEKCNLPDSLEKMGERAFACELTDVVLPTKLQALPTNVFAMTKIQEVVIPNNIKVIGERAFEDCANLSVVTIEDGVEIIKDSAFAGTDVLETVIIPASVTEIDECAFLDSNLEVIIITPAGSYAEQYAIENEIAYQNE